MLQNILFHLLQHLSQYQGRHQYRRLSHQSHCRSHSKDSPIHWHALPIRYRDKHRFHWLPRLYLHLLGRWLRILLEYIHSHLLRLLQEFRDSGLGYWSPHRHHHHRFRFSLVLLPHYILLRSLELLVGYRDIDLLRWAHHPSRCLIARQNNRFHPQAYPVACLDTDRLHWLLRQSQSLQSCSRSIDQL